jgi:serine/threonine protein kinase
MATGRTPFEASSPAQILAQHIQVEAPRAHQLQPEVSEALSALIHRCLAKEPDDRFQSAAELAEALRPTPTASGRRDPLGTVKLATPSALPSEPQTP